MSLLRTASGEVPAATVDLREFQGPVLQGADLDPAEADPDEIVRRYQELVGA